MHQVGGQHECLEHGLLYISAVFSKTFLGKGGRVITCFPLKFSVCYFDFKLIIWFCGTCSCCEHATAWLRVQPVSPWAAGERPFVRWVPARSRNTDSQAHRFSLFRPWLLAEDEPFLVDISTEKPGQGFLWYLLRS